MPAFHSDAINLNNQGVTHVEAGEYGVARTKFRKALDLIKSGSLLQSKRKLAHYAGESSVGLGWSKTMPIHSTKNSLRPSSHPSSVSSFVYSRAISIFPLSENASEACVTETVSMLYNLSLSFHLEGQATNNSALLSQASKAYKMALGFRRKQRQCKQLLGRGDRLIDVAINNNMAMIYQEFVDYQSAKKCFTQVSRGLGLFGDETSGFLDEAEHHGLVMNLMMSRSQEKGSAAAA